MSRLKLRAKQQLVLSPYVGLLMSLMFVFNGQRTEPLPAWIRVVAAFFASSFAFFIALHLVNRVRARRQTG